MEDASWWLLRSRCSGTLNVDPAPNRRAGTSVNDTLVSLQRLASGGDHAQCRVGKYLRRAVVAPLEPRSFPSPQTRREKSCPARSNPTTWCTFLTSTLERRRPS